MAVTYEPMTTLIDNVTMDKVLIDGVHRQTRLSPNDGYVLNKKSSGYEDYDNLDEMGNPIFVNRFVSGSTTVRYDYDFDNVVAGTYTYTDENGNTVDVPVDMVGVEEFYAVPANIVPSNQIYGVVNPPVTE